MKNLFNLRYLWLNNLCWIGFGVVDLPQEISKLQNYKITKLHACMCMFFVGIYRVMGVVEGLWGVEKWEMLFGF